MHAHHAVITSLMLCSAAIAQEGSSNKRSGERLISINSGEDSTGVVSYGLYCTAAKNVPEGKNLLLVLRNIGAKNVRMDKVTAGDFDLHDKSGKSIKIHLRNAPQTMAFGDIAIAHLLVATTPNSPQPWTLHFKSSPGVVVRFELTIPDITTNHE